MTSRRPCLGRFAAPATMTPRSCGTDFPPLSSGFRMNHILSTMLRPHCLVRAFLFIALLSATVVPAVAAGEVQGLDIKARQFLIMDAQTGTVLDAKNPDEHMPPSSMSKLMTIY